MKFEEVGLDSLLAHYSNEVCSHVEASIGLFFGLIGTLVIMEIVNVPVAYVIFSIVYFFLGGLGVYFYVRLFYYRKLLEEILLKEPYRDNHLKFQRRVFLQSKLIKATQSISITGKSEYRLRWAWLMLVLAVISAILSWLVVVFYTV